jgi:outer membrane protein assembly factor BamB/regulation of enolase protein 1 (concanavalin A-like superfamily)
MKTNNSSITRRAMKTSTITKLSAFVLAVVAYSAVGDDQWPQFRGPGSRGLAAEKSALPHRWSATENVAWVAEVPGLGWSSPVVWGGRVFLTSAVRVAGEEAPQVGLYLGKARGGDEHRFLVHCYELATGKQLWEREVHRGPTQPIHLKNSYASATPVVDAAHVVALFHDVGLFALDHDGKPLWSVPIPVRKTRSDWGHGGSPALHDGRVYLVSDNEEASSIAAFDATTGSELWRMPREPETNYSTPFVWTEPTTGPQLIVPATKRTIAYDLAGKEAWSFTGGMSALTICTPLAANGLLFVGSGYFQSPVRGLFAIKPTARGDITLPADEKSSDAIAWANLKAASYNPSPLVFGDELYILYDQGMLACYDAKTGKPHYEKTRLAPAAGGFTASPWAHDGKIFCLSERAETFVVKAGTQFELLGRNALEPEPCLATPALLHDSIVLRTGSKLYLLREKGGDTSPSPSLPPSQAASAWQWVRPAAGATKDDGTALRLRNLPGNLMGNKNSTANLALRPLPTPLADGAASEVTIDAKPEAAFEQAGLLWYADDDHYVKIIVERLGAVTLLNFASEDAGRFRLWRALDGRQTSELKLTFPQGRAALVKVGDAANQPIELPSIITPVQLRLSLVGGKVRGEFRHDAQKPWQLLAECPLPTKLPTHAALATMQGTSGADRWSEFRSFRITP